MPGPQTELADASGSPIFSLSRARTIRCEAVSQLSEAAPGGRAFFTERADELHDIFNELLEEFSQQYGLGYQSTNSARDDTWRQIKVDVEGQRRVRARQGYRAPALSGQRKER